MGGNSIFLKYFLISEPLLSMLQYNLSVLPGIKEGISGSTVDGNNIGIIKNIAEDKKDAAIEVLKFFTSKEYQKNGFKDKKTITVLKDLWYDEDVCKNGLCDVLKKSQIIVEPKFIKNRSDNYWEKYQNSIYQYLFENATIDETLKQINDITKIYYITLDVTNTYVGLLCFILILIVSLIMLASVIFPFLNNYQKFFMFLTEDFWIVTILGSILIICTQYINYGHITTLKCYLTPLLLSIGFTLNVTPILYVLIVQFPERNKLTVWIYWHRYLFLLFNILVDVLISSISLIHPYTVRSIIVEGGENFEICKFSGEYTTYIYLIYKFLVILLMLLLIFVEWNFSGIRYDLRFIVVALYIDILAIINIYVFSILKNENYKIYFLIKIIIALFVSLSNHFFFCGYRILLGFFNKQDIKLQFIQYINDNFINSQTSQQKTNSNCYSTNINSSLENNTNNINVSNELSSVDKPNFIVRMINYHYSFYSAPNISTSSNTYNTFKT